MSERYPFTYLSFTCDQSLEEVQSSHPELIAIADKIGQSEAGCGFLIHICDVTEWWKQEDELLELLTEHYLSLYFLIDPTSHAVASLYMGSNHKTLIVSPQLMAICSSLRIEINIFMVETYPPAPTDDPSNLTN